MSKRFTDTELYDQEWFLSLPPRLKCAWDVLCKRCDVIGVWHISMTKLSFEVGEPVTLDELVKHFKVQPFGEDKLFIPGFVGFQYGDEGGRLSLTNRFHLSIAEKLRALSLPEPEWKPTKEPNAHGQGIDTLSNAGGSTQGQGQGKGNKGEGECEGKPEPEDLLRVWNEERGPLPAVEKFTQKRRDHSKAQLAKNADLDHYRLVIQRWLLSDFCLETWKPGFDELLNENKRVSTLEGKYDNRKPKVSKNGPLPFVASNTPIPPGGLKIDPIAGPQTEPGPRTTNIETLNALIAKAGNLGLKKQGAS